MESTEKSIVVLLPCRNEETTITKVVEGFKEALPDAVVYVYDNASTDKTALKASEAGAKVLFESKLGKGHVVRRMFADVEADIYLIADGDATYDPTEAPLLLKTLSEGGYDMVSGSRTGVKGQADRKGHVLGNRMFNRLYKALFGSGFTDIFTGYRAFTRRFVKSFPMVSSGFEVEVELSVHASQLRLPVAEIPINYGARPIGSKSKLRTFTDGFKILKSMLTLLKDNRPLFLFASVSAILFTTAVGITVPLINTYAQTGLVPRLPTAIVSMGLVLLSLLSAISGLILDAISKSRVEAKHLTYLKTPLNK